jgi:hypothetical protein
MRATTITYLPSGNEASPALLLDPPVGKPGFVTMERLVLYGRNLHQYNETLDHNINKRISVV